MCNFMKVVVFLLEVTWRCKKQNVVQSNAEADYRDMASTTSEIVSLRPLLHNLDCGSTQPIQIFCDNKVSIYIDSNPVFYEWIKHIDVDCHFVWENLQANVICTLFVRSDKELDFKIYSPS